MQPDLFYYAGMIPTMQVARMAEVAGLQIAPHISGGGLGYVYMLQMISACPAAAEYHKFKMFNTCRRQWNRRSRGEQCGTL